MPSPRFVQTKLEGVLLVKPPTVFEDHRGFYVETWNKALYEEIGIDQEWVCDDISVSRCGVLRGIHGDFKTWKLVSCLHGAFYLVVVNMQEGHPQYREWASWTLSDRNRTQVLVPPGYGNGHLVLSSWAIFHYKQSAYYDRAGQFTVKWNDPTLGIWWPYEPVMMSERDERGDYDR